MVVQELKRLIGFGQAIDLKERTFNVGNHQITMLFNAFLTSAERIDYIIASLNNIDANQIQHSLIDTIMQNIVNENINIDNNLEKISADIFAGDTAIITDVSEWVIIAETKAYPGRQIGEPDSEKVVRGSRDGFTESIAINIGLVRRRIKDGNLRIKLYTVGKISKTLVTLIYLEGQVDEKIINRVEEKLTKLNVEELTMCDKALEELIIDNNYTPYPLVRYTERPDTFATHLYQGMFGILVDTSPSAILGPVSIFDHMQHPEDYRQTIIVGSYLRIIRYLGIIFAFLIIPVWFTLCYYQSAVPDILLPYFDFTKGYQSIFWQIIIIEIGIEIIRMASIYTPSALSTSMGLIVGVAVGGMAISVGVLSETIALLGVISAIGTYITPSYELSLANKLARILLLLLIYFFHVYGLIFGLLFLICYLTIIKSFGRSYLYPLIPFNGRQLLKQLFRVPYRNKNKK